MMEGSKVERDGKTWPAKLTSIDADLDLPELSVARLKCARRSGSSQFHL
jgi:hypothetical protein